MPALLQLVELCRLKSWSTVPTAESHERSYGFRPLTGRVGAGIVREDLYDGVQRALLIVTGDFDVDDGPHQGTEHDDVENAARVRDLIAEAERDAGAKPLGTPDDARCMAEVKSLAPTNGKLG